MSTRMRGGWELECRSWRAIPEWGLLSTAGRGPEETGGGTSWWEVLLEENQAVTEAERYCWVTCRVWPLHCSLSPYSLQHFNLDAHVWSCWHQLGVAFHRPDQCLSGIPQWGLLGLTQWMQCFLPISLIPLLCCLGMRGHSLKHGISGLGCRISDVSSWKSFRGMWNKCCLCSLT